MKTLDSDLKVNRNIYPDLVTCDRMRLIGPKNGQLGPINHCLLEKSQLVFRNLFVWNMLI